AEEGSEIVLGTTAESKEVFQQQLEQGTFENDLKKVTVKPGEFYFVPAGTLHSIGSGIIAYEVMQSSDISYRIYDYKRAK
ncbi:mannose-6-phosphate isomerase, partial [Staphylococcus saprophyticus]